VISVCVDLMCWYCKIWHTNEHEEVILGMQRFAEVKNAPIILN